jgi:hypothetical protein
MTTKRTKAAAQADLDELFEGLGDEAAPKKGAKAKAAGGAPKPKGQPEQDILAELENQLGEKQPSRPHTPRIKEVAAKGSPAKRAATGTPPPPGERLSEDRPSNAARKSAESTRSFHATLTPSVTSSEMPESERKAAAEPAQGGGWWGGIFATASAAMKQAEAAVKEIQQNEEAKKWADQVRGNYSALRGYGKLPNISQPLRITLIWH